MFKARLFIFASLVLVYTPPSTARDIPIDKRVFLVSGSTLLAKCTSQDQADNTFCMGYVAGVSDGFASAVGIEPSLDVVIPKLDMHVNGPVIIDKVVSNLMLVRDDKIPNMTLDEPASSAVFIAIKQISKVQAVKP